MEPYKDNIVTASMMLGGFESAFERFHDAVKGRDAETAFVGLFECLNWAVALDERVAQHWAPRGAVLGWHWRDEVPGAELLRGVRWSRNSVHHKWTDALRLTDGGARFPMTFPVVFHEWIWASVEELPALDRDDPAGEAVYRDRLAGHPARVTLGELLGAFRFVGRVLEPPTAGSTPPG